MRSHQLLAHTADVRLRAAGNSLEELFRAALEGVNELLKPGDYRPSKTPQKEELISVVSSDTTSLLIDFLSEVLAHSYTRKVLYCQLEFLQLDEDSLQAKISGHRTSGFAKEVKAVTYHEAEIKKTHKNRYEITIVLDI